MSKVILYLKKRITVYFLWLLTPREIILRQRDKIYGINLSTRKQSAMLFFVVGALFLEINLAIGYLKKPGIFRIAGSLNILNKNGSTFCNLSGPPKLNNITAFFIKCFFLL